MGILQITRRAASLLPTVNDLRRDGNFAGAILYFLYSMLNFKRPIKLSIRSQPIRIRPCTPDLAVARACFGGEFDAAIKAATPLKHQFIVDAGGYIGTSAIVFAKAFPDARIVTLEPSLENFGLLCKNTEVYPNVIALNKALGAFTSTIPLRNRGTGEWGFSIVQEPADCTSAPTLHDVTVTTIPALLHEFSAAGIDLLKLDIEGGELELLRNDTSWLPLARVIMAELHDRIVPGCVETFEHAMRDRARIQCGGEKVISTTT